MEHAMEERSTVAERARSETQVARLPLVSELALHVIGPDGRLWHSDKKPHGRVGRR